MNTAARRASLFALAALAGCGPQTAGPHPQVDEGWTFDLSVIDDSDGGTKQQDLAVPTDTDAAPPEADLAVSPDLAVFACGVPLTIKPADHVMLVDGVHAFTVKHQVLCKAADVTHLAALTLDDVKLGAFKNDLFTSTAGAVGVSTVRATLGADKGATSLTLKLTTAIITPGTDPLAPGKFGGAADPNLAPEWVYPADGVLVPPNLSELEFHFLPKGNTLFELAITGNGATLKIYTKCNPIAAGCGYLPDEPTWALLSQASKNKTLTLTLRGTSGNAVGAAAGRKLAFGNDDITGGLYYWAASNGGIYRYDFGLRGQKAEAFYTPPQAGAMCVGCHALSRDGTRIAVGMNIPGPALLRTLDVGTKKKLFDFGGGIGPLATGSNYEALTPDGTTMVTTEKGGLTVRDVATGQVMGQNPAVDNANMPDFSADGKQLVFARGTPLCMLGFCNTLGVDKAGLYTVPWNGGAFGAVKSLVPPGNGNNYYPAFAPDGKSVVFNRSAVESFDAKDAKVMAVSTAGGNPVELAALNNPVGSSWPKSAPFVHKFDGKNIFWVTFSTRRPYGLRGGTSSQIWMAAVDGDKVANGQDGSYPPFWLPFQDFATGNHIPQWAEKVVRAPCTEGHPMDCAQGEWCVRGKCVPK
ncbi:MAG: hypothetical protein EXR72_16970 [Myxococcales bacterium]|nr:hypothetical protein [Myxococcales bacterium]